MINPYTTEIIQNMTFKGHTGPVTGINFTNKDLHMWTSGLDGKFFRWELDK